jgi:hypothetical protein
MSEDLNGAKNLIKTYGVEMTGAAISESASSLFAAAIAGGTMGSIATPVGAFIGAGLGVTFKILAEIATRSLSSREKVRVGAAASFALVKIKQRLDSGESTRNDTFFSSNGNSRSEAEEILEGVLLKSKNEHEEKKVRIFGNIFANIAFTPELRVGEANHILQIAENLTYRQMCILALFHRKDEIGDLQLAESLYRSQSFETISILQEIYQLYNFGLLARLISDSSDSSDYSDAFISSASSDYLALSNWEDVKPNQIELTPLGKRYYAVMGLDEVSSIDLRDVAIFLVTK